MNSENNNSNNNDLKSFSLGTTDGIESLDLDGSSNINLNGPFGEVPPLGEIPPIGEVPPVSPLNQEVNQMPNNMNLMNGVNDIPPVPTLDNNNQFNNFTDVNMGMNNASNEVPQLKKKKKSPLPIIIIIVALVLVGAMAAFWFFTNFNNTNKNVVSVVPKEVHIERGTALDNISLDIDYWATFNGVNKDSCTLDASSITDTSELNKEYEFTVKCGEKSYKGKAVIVDTIAPVVVTKDVQASLNSNLDIIDFIESCSEEQCSYEFKDYAKFQENLKNAGTYLVEIVVKDEAGNVTEVSATLSVVNIDFYLVCSKTLDNGSRTDKLAFYQSNFTKTAQATRTYVFDSQESYLAVKNSNPENVVMIYEDFSGMPTFDDSTLSLTLTKSVTYDDLNGEFNTTLPLAYSDLSSFYQSPENGYFCTMAFE